jgi:hypothetical protein
MNAEEGLGFVEELLRQSGHKPLSDLQRAVFLGSWQGHGYNQIYVAVNRVVSSKHIERNVGPDLWKVLSHVLSDVLGEPVKVQKSYLKAPIEQARDRRLKSKEPTHSKVVDGDSHGLAGSDFDVNRGLSHAHQRLDDVLEQDLNQMQTWGDAPDVSLFQGRDHELAQLQQWIELDGCRLVTLYGLPGIGKTDLSVRLAQTLRQSFDVVFWRSLKYATFDDTPSPLIQLLAPLIQPTPDQALPPNPLPHLLDTLRQRRCLLVLDGWERVLKPGDPNGAYLEDYGEYGNLLERFRDVPHQSCLILTSREQPIEIETRAGEYSLVRSLQLRGISGIDAQELAQRYGDFTGSSSDWRMLVHRYDGNPAFLRQIFMTIMNAFDHNIRQFLDFQDESTVLVGAIRKQLAQQLNRLSPLEQTLMGLLAHHQEPISLPELWAKLQQQDAAPPPREQALNALLALKRRSLLDINATLYSLHSLAAEYALQTWKI